MNRDVFEYILKLSDERTALNMLSVNKKFRTEEYFKRYLLYKYPILQPQNNYKSFFLQNIEFMVWLREKKFIFYSEFMKTWYRCAVHEDDPNYHIEKSPHNFQKCDGCTHCLYDYGEICHSFLSYLIKMKFWTDKQLEKYFHLEHINLIAHKSHYGLCPKFSENACKHNKMFKLTPDIVKSLCIS